jgi:CBS domain containing-hemolysin-like protein
VEQTGDTTYSVIATAAITDINDRLPHPIDKTKQYDTLAGYLIDKFGKIPNAHEKLKDEGYEFTVLQKNKTSITLVQLRDMETGNEAEENAK